MKCTHCCERTREQGREMAKLPSNYKRESNRKEEKNLEIKTEHSSTCFVYIYLVWGWFIWHGIHNKNTNSFEISSMLTITKINGESHESRVLSAYFYVRAIAMWHVAFFMFSATITSQPFEQNIANKSDGKQRRQQHTQTRAQAHIHLYVLVFLLSSNLQWATSMVLQFAFFLKLSVRVR